jgi:hypothetical protein
VDGEIYAIGGSPTGYPWTPIPTVEIYDTGFIPSSVQPKGKLIKPWGQIRSE